MFKYLSDIKGTEEMVKRVEAFQYRFDNTLNKEIRLIDELAMGIYALTELYDYKKLIPVIDGNSYLTANTIFFINKARCILTNKPSIFKDSLDADDTLKTFAILYIAFAETIEGELGIKLLNTNISPNININIMSLVEKIRKLDIYDECKRVYDSCKFYVAIRSKYDMRREEYTDQEKVEAPIIKPRLNLPYILKVDGTPCDPLPKDLYVNDDAEQSLSDNYSLDEIKKYIIEAIDSSSDITFADLKIDNDDITATIILKVNLNDIIEGESQSNG